MTSLGAVFRPQSPPERLREVAEAAEAAGLDQLWLWEDCFLESGIASAAAVLAWTERLKVGIGLLPVPLRNAAVTSMEAATLHRLFPGRFVLGLGHGVQSWMGQVGARAESPLTLLREHLDATRALLRGERVTAEGRYVRLDGVALDWPPSAPAPVFAGAKGPRTVRLSGEAADGTIFESSTTPADLRAGLRLIEEGRADAGRADDHHVLVYMTAVTGPDAENRLRAELALDGRETAPGLGAAGDAQTIAKAVEQLADAGADSVVLQSTADERDPVGFVRFVAEEVRPLVG
ncbi:LLM class flavin-dependent oxidoreductase [Streptomyces sp. TRM66268-LWL]|uniref:LLM class flavin-dependent oxidoreductase n=1 Tax=Streptomyces polyasparticus TaxID=2767826 RepID=A0ABR7SEH0_9ACTN|nr:LLM class flavin-dependent oxidoreductase [Streptomyces polyasparticus]MBC9713569.1 LLM class flavin-dependent oxidoreductase [Streptomyces polyasparticus]